MTNSRMIVATIALSLLGCQKSGKSSAPSASVSASAAAAPALKPGVDAALLGELTNLTKTCKIDEKAGSVDCPQNEQRKLTSDFVSNQRSRPKAVATFAAALGDPNVQLRAMAANVLHGAFRSPWGPDAKAGSVSADDAKALLDAALALPKAEARQAMPAAVHASMLAGTAPALYEALDKSKESDLAPIAYRYLMTHGRLDAFPKVQELVKNTNTGIALAALESPRNMLNWTTAEQAAICPWAEPFLGDQRPAIAAKAGTVLSGCSGEFIDKLLDNGEAAVKAKTFTGSQLTAFRDLCAPRANKQQEGASEQQCARTRKLLEGVVENKALDEATRVTALSALSYQWPDDKALKLAQKLAKGPDKNLAEQAKRTAERLEQRNAAAAATDKKPGKPGAPKPAAPKPAAPAPQPAAE
jgi:hypothetical protein